MPKTVNPAKRPAEKARGKPAKKSEPIERLIVEMPEEKHRAIKIRAASLGMSVKDYALHAIEQHARVAKEELAAHPNRTPIEGSWHQKRIAIDTPIPKAAEIKAMSQAFGTIREFILRCIDIEMRSVITNVP
jgi:hypothetical protein